MHGILEYTRSLSFLGLTALANAYEIGFVGYDDETFRAPTEADVVWQTVPADANIATCHHITPRWADNIEYAFVRTLPTQDPIPRFIGFYGNNGRPQTGCINFNLNVIVKWEPNRGDRLQMANTFRRDLNRWAVLVPGTSQTERVERVLRSLERDYQGGRTAWKESGNWQVDRDGIRLFGLNETWFERLDEDIINSENESDYNYDNDEEGDDEDSQGGEGWNAQGGENRDGNALGSPAGSVSTAGSEQHPKPNAWAGNILGSNYLLQEFMNLIFRQVLPVEEIRVAPGVNPLLDLGYLGPPIGGNLDLGDEGLDAGEVGVDALELRRVLSGTGTPDTELDQGNPLDDLE
ncbi:hypothetical protein TWF718_002446 [Orbilia javanica]|uniref:Uncharacterized protein n=1 Tax=Orbilia javanica TaxID=47235 RepID=A0AAN8MR45_9PEZI